MRLFEIPNALRRIEWRLEVMSQALDNLTAQVAAQEAVEASVITLLQTLKSELDAAISSGDDAAVQAIADKLGTDTQALSDAVTANTPAAAPAAPVTTDPNAPVVTDPNAPVTDPNAPSA